MQMEGTTSVSGVDEEIPLKKSKFDENPNGENETFANADVALEVGSKFLEKSEAPSASRLQSAEDVRTALLTLPEIPTSQLSNLPRLVIANVCAHLSLKDKKAMRLISRHWQNEMRAERLVVMHTHVITDKSWATFPESTCPIDSVFFKELSNKETPYIDGLGYFWQVKLGPKICVQFLKVFLENCTEFLESLAISRFVLSDLTSEIIQGGIQFKNLTSLSLAVAVLSDFTNEWKSALEFFKYARISKLTQLEFHLSHKGGESERQSPITTIQWKFFEFIETHLQHIRILKYSLDSHEKGQFKPLKIPARFLAALPTSKIREIALTTNSRGVYREFITALILKVDSPLTKIKIHLSENNERTYNPFGYGDYKISEDIFQKHGRTLEEIDIALLATWLDLDIAFLKLCPNLKKLSLNAEGDLLNRYGCRISLPSLKKIRIRLGQKRIRPPFNLMSIEDLTHLEYLDTRGCQLFHNGGNLYPDLTEFRIVIEQYFLEDINAFLHSMTTTMPQLQIAKLLGLTLELEALKILLSMPHLNTVYVVGVGEGVGEFCQTWIEPMIVLSKILQKTAAKLHLIDKTDKTYSCKNKIVFWR